MKNYQMELCGVQRTLPFIPDQRRHGLRQLRRARRYRARQRLRAGPGGKDRSGSTRS